MSRNKFILDIIDNHPVIKTDDYTILIDTGSPVTVHNQDLFYFLSDKFDILPYHSKLSIQKLSKLTNINNLTTLLGTDIMSKYKILFDYKHKQIIFNHLNDNSFEAKSMNIHSFLDIPVIELKINNELLKFFLDSGAKYSYLLKSITEKYKSVGKINDFYPGIGIFESDSYQINTEFDNNIFSAVYGVLPENLEFLLQKAELSGIIGSDFFYNFKTEIDLKSNKLKYIFNS